MENRDVPVRGWLKYFRRIFKGGKLKEGFLRIFSTTGIVSDISFLKIQLEIEFRNTHVILLKNLAYSYVNANECYQLNLDWWIKLIPNIIFTFIKPKISKTMCSCPISIISYRYSRIPTVSTKSSTITNRWRPFVPLPSMSYWHSQIGINLQTRKLSYENEC